MPRGENFAEELCEILVANGVIKDDEAQGLQEEFDDSDQVQFDDFLLSEGLIDKEDLLKALSDYYQVPFMDPEGYFFDHDLVIKFPQDFLVRNGIIPAEVDEDIIVFIANDPNQEGLESAIREYVSYDVEFWVGLRQPIIDAIRDYYQESITELPEDETLQDEEEEFEAEEDIVDIT
jgi:MshEN domain